MEAREIRVNLMLMAVIIPIMVLIATSHLAFAYNDPKHCSDNACFSIGYDDGYSDAQKGSSPAYACVSHSQGWCDGYNAGFRAGNGGSNNYFGPNTGQSASINIRGNNDKVSINQRTDNQVGGNGFSTMHMSNGGALPTCLILCINSDIRIN